MKGIKSFDKIFAKIIHSPKSTFLPSFSEIDALSCNTPCMVLPGFLMDTVYLEVSSHSSAFAERGFQQFIDEHIEALHSFNWTELINYFS